MADQLKAYCQSIVPLSQEEESLIDTYFEPFEVKRKDYLIEQGKKCNFIAFISEGIIRHFHVKDGDEKTCDITFENNFITEFQSFTTNSPSYMSFQALADTKGYLISRGNLEKLYAQCSKYETIGRLMAEKVARRSTEIAMSLSSDKPQTRYLKLIENQPDLFQRVPQRYIANFLGISPESLSRIRKRLANQKS